MSILKIGDKVKIIDGPRTGEIGVVDLIVSNGMLVKTKDGFYHTLQDRHVKKVEISKQKPK